MFLKKIKPVYWIILTICLFIAVLPYWFTNIQIIGKENMKIEYGQKYQELGAKGSFLKKELKVVTQGEVDTQKLGTYKVTYQVKNKLGIMKKKNRTITVVDTIPPVITLKGEKQLVLKYKENYKEPGYTMIDNRDGDISRQVIIKNNINIEKPGTYEVTYEGKDSEGNKTETKRIVKVLEQEITYQDSYDKVDNSHKTWWSGNKKDHKRPLIGAADTVENLKKYNAYYMGPDEKTIYLTFDEGSNDTYVKEIVDVLNKNDVKGTFFFCNQFILSNPELMKLLANTGHSVGNHTKTHHTMSEYATKANFQKFVEEIRTVEESFYKITGKPLDKVYREPRGDWSYRSLQIVKDMGYKSFFWSADYLDWNGDVTKEYAFENYMSRYHNGAIYLIHPKNKGNYEAMDTFIKKLKTLGYRFDLVKNIK